MVLQKKWLFLAVASCALLTGCSSGTSDKLQPQKYNVTPQEAHYVSKDSHYKVQSVEKNTPKYLTHNLNNGVQHQGFNYSLVPSISKQYHVIHKVYGNFNLYFNHNYDGQIWQTSLAIDLKWANHEAPIANKEFQKKYHTKQILYPKSLDGNYATYFYTHSRSLTVFNKALRSKNNEGLADTNEINKAKAFERQIFQNVVNATLCTDDLKAQVIDNQKPEYFKDYQRNNISPKQREVRSRLDGLTDGFQKVMKYDAGFSNYALHKKHNWKYYFSHKHPKYQNYISHINLQ